MAPQSAHANDANIKVSIHFDDYFVVADDQRLISIWHFEQEKVETTEGASMMFQSPAKKKAGFYYKIKPMLQCAFNLSRIDVDGTFKNETILAINMLHTDHLPHLLVSTTKRFVLLRLDKHHPSGLVKVNGYTEIDHVEPTHLAIFGITIAESAVKDGRVQNTRFNFNVNDGMVRSNPLDRKPARAANATANPTTPTGPIDVCTPPKRTITAAFYWKVINMCDQAAPNTWIGTRTDLCGEAGLNAIYNTIQPLPM